MGAELIISIISLASTFVLGVFTAFMTFKVKTIEHIESLKKYEKNITNFELQFKDEQWLYNLFESGEFDHYNMKSKKRIFKWWHEYMKSHTPVLLHSQVDYNKLCMGPDGWCGSDGKVHRINTGGASTELVMPGDDIPNAEDLF